MEPVPFGGDSEGREIQQVIGQFDAPAYLRRARGVEQALAYLLQKCRSQREEWLQMVKLRLGQLHALAGEWSVLLPLVADAEQLVLLEALRTQLDPKLRVPVEPTTSQRALRSSLRELVESIERFNQRWHAYLEKVDCSVINQLREGYNRYYVLEKACALRSDKLAGKGFVALPPLTLAELLDHLPPLPLPRLA